MEIHLKSMNIYYKSMKIIEQLLKSIINRWNQWKSIKNPWKSMNIYENPWKSMKIDNTSLCYGQNSHKQPASGLPDKHGYIQWSIMQG